MSKSQSNINGSKKSVGNSAKEKDHHMTIQGQSSQRLGSSKNSLTNMNSQQ